MTNDKTSPLNWLTEDEIKIINFLKKGEVISGKEITDNAINFFIDSCLQKRKDLN